MKGITVELDEKAASRLWSKIDRRGPDECWECAGYVSPGGGALFSVMRGGVAQTMSVLRLVWELEGRGRLEPSQSLIRLCGNKRCVNPAHMVVARTGQKLSDVQARRRPSIVELARRAGARLATVGSGRYIVVGMDSRQNDAA